ncbi:MAG: hypothetical protein Q9208_004509 [Pyrenodesmia sp. 3 TL-2023]
MDPRFSHLTYSWELFETEEDLAQEQLYEHAFKSTEYCESPSPMRNPESPLDDQDFERFERKTARLASISEESTYYGSMPPTPRIEPIVSPDNDDFDDEVLDTTTDLPPPVIKFTSASPERILAAFSWVLESIDAFEDAIEDRQSYLENDIMDRQVSFEKEVMDVLRKLTTRIDMLIDERLRPRQLMETGTPTDDVRDHPRTEDELHTNDNRASNMPDDQWTPSQLPATQSPLAEKYIQDWHSGGLLLIENISQHTPLREIYTLFHIHGRITYLELHAADKSKPHLPTRHAYIHYREHSQALQARRALHHYKLHGNILMVFNLSTDVVRGEPGKPYTGPALEILNFNGGSNYASPAADFRQPAEDLLQMDEEQQYNIPIPVLRPTVRIATPPSLKPQLTGTTAAASATYSLKPQLTGKTAAASWRKPDVPVAVKEMGERADEEEGESDADEAVVFLGKRRWSRLSTFATISECDYGSEPEDEDGGGVYLASEDEEGEEGEEEGSIDLAYMESDDEEDLRFYAPVELLEFL